MSRETSRELVEALSNAFRASQNDSDTFDEQASRLLGLNRTDLRCMDIIQRNEPMAAGHLAQEAELSTGAVTAVIDRMEKAGWVRRVQDPKDRRRVLVELTPKANEATEKIWGPMYTDSVAWLSGLSEDELRFLLDFLNAGRELSQRHRERVKNLEL